MSSPQNNKWMMTIFDEIVLEEGVVGKQSIGFIWCRPGINDHPDGRGFGSRKSDADRWIIQVEQNEEDIADRSSATMFRVPPRLRECIEYYYILRIVSIGPCHFNYRKLSSIEHNKDEAMRRMQRRIQVTSPGITIKSIVESRIVGMDSDIRNLYAEEIPYSPIVLALMAREMPTLFLNLY